MKAPELTDELKNDLKALKMRASITVLFYKKNDRDGFLSTYRLEPLLTTLLTSTIHDFPRNKGRRTIVEELLADSELRRYNRRKYSGR